MNKSMKLTLIPVMLCFFAMGFVDLVGIASNYVKEDLNLNDATANLFPSLVFFWFLIFSVPTGMLMNKIGRKKTVLLSLLVTVISLLLPLFGETFGIMLVSFSLLGIGNALMQTSLNPLVSAVTSGKNLASTLTFGQFVKAIASFMAPYIAMWGAVASIPEFGLGWRVLFPIYMIIGVCATLFLAGTPIEEEKTEGKASGFVDCLALLGKPIVLLSFIGIMCHVGIDVGTNTTAPKILMERLGWTLNEAAALLHLPYYRMFHRHRLPSYDEAPCVLHHQHRDDGAEYGRPLLRREQDDALYCHCPRGLRQLQCVLHHLLAGSSLCTREEERGERSDDHGLVWRYGIPTHYGCCQRCHRTDRCCIGDGSGRALSVLLY